MSRTATLRAADLFSSADILSVIAFGRRETDGAGLPSLGVVMDSGGGIGAGPGVDGARAARMTDGQCYDSVPENWGTLTRRSRW
jgi:hypothetical protein